MPHANRPPREKHKRSHVVTNSMQILKMVHIKKVFKKAFKDMHTGCFPMCVSVVPFN